MLGRAVRVSLEEFCAAIEGAELRREGYGRALLPEELFASTVGEWEDRAAVVPTFGGRVVAFPSGRNMDYCGAYRTRDAVEQLLRGAAEDVRTEFRYHYDLPQVQVEIAEPRVEDVARVLRHFGVALEGIVDPAPEAPAAQADAAPAAALAVVVPPRDVVADASLRIAATQLCDRIARPGIRALLAASGVDGVHREAIEAFAASPIGEAALRMLLAETIHLIPGVGTATALRRELRASALNVVGDGFVAALSDPVARVIRGESAAGGATSEPGKQRTR